MVVKMDISGLVPRSGISRPKCTCTVFLAVEELPFTEAVPLGVPTSNVYPCLLPPQSCQQDTWSHFWVFANINEKWYPSTFLICICEWSWAPFLTLMTFYMLFSVNCLCVLCIFLLNFWTFFSSSFEIILYIREVSTLSVRGSAQTSYQFISWYLTWFMVFFKS